MSGADLFGIGRSGLLTAKQGLATTGHNIANVNTPGFSRQRVELVERPPQGFGFGFVGSGVEISTIRRVFDGFLVDQVRTSTASASELQSFHDLARQVDALLASPESGLAPPMQEFFSSLHDLANDPSSVPARQVVLGQADTLVNRFHSLDQRLDDLRDGVNEALRGSVQEVNTLAGNIAELNRRIALAQANAGGNPANDLLDQRDELLRQLSEKVGITTVAQGNGQINVSTGGGQALVVGTAAATLSVVGNAFDPTRAEVSQTLAGISGVISDRLSGGEIGGLLDFRQRVLDPASDALGRVALGVSATLNRQHRLGMDLSGTPGGDFFTPLTVANPAMGTGPSVLPSAANTGSPPASINVSISDVGALAASDYRLDNTAGTFTLTRLSDSKVFTLSGFPASAQTVDGLRLSLGAGTIAAGDSFIVRPVRDAAGDISVAVATPGEIAAAAPILASAALTNTGSAEVSAGRVNSPDDGLRISFTGAATFDVLDTTTGATLASGASYVSGAPISFNGLSFAISNVPAAGDVFLVDHTVTSPAGTNSGSGAISQATVAATDPNLTDPLTITFASPPTTFTVSGATSGSPTVNVPYTSGAPVSFDGLTITLSGAPGAGDVFTVGPNAGGVGDNRNALALAGLQSIDRLEGGQSTFGEAYGRLIADVGTVTRQAEVNETAQRFLLAQSVESRDAVSGVNLDEEAANLLELQQAFQASAKVVAVADEIFSTLLDALAR